MSFVKAKQTTHTNMSNEIFFTFHLVFFSFCTQIFDPWFSSKWRIPILIQRQPLLSHFFFRFWIRVSWSGLRGLFTGRWSRLSGFLELDYDHSHIVTSLAAGCRWCQAPLKHSLTHHRKLAFLQVLDCSVLLIE